MRQPLLRGRHLIRNAGDTLVLSPPLIIAESEIEKVFATIRRALDTLD